MLILLVCAFHGFGVVALAVAFKQGKPDLCNAATVLFMLGAAASIMLMVDAIASL